jgi:tyrosine-protein kinase Etk/Wzc
MNHPIRHQPLRQIEFNHPYVQPTIEPDEPIDLRKYLDFLSDYRWFILGVTLVVTLLGVAYAWIAKPIYEATILIQVEGASAPPISKTSAAEDSPPAVDLKTATAAEMEVLRSRMVVSRAVDNTRYYIDVQPKYFPQIGAWLARQNKQLSEPGLFGYGGYVWGSERADVAVFNVPEELQGETFVLTAGNNGSFSLAQEDAGIALTGQAGSTLSAQTEQGTIELRVDSLAAKPGAQFSLIRWPRLDTIETLQQTLKIYEKGRNSGVIGVALEGPNRKRTTSVLNEIGNEYIRQNEYRRSETAEKSLAFLNRQLPELRAEMVRSETAYNLVRNKHGTINLEEEAKALLQHSVTTQTRMVELSQRKQELLVRFQNEHPMVQAINQQMRVLNREMAAVNTKIKRLPEVEQDVLRLSRDVKVNTDVYTAVLSTAQQLRLVTASKVGNVRLLDSPEMPVKPIKPDRRQVVLNAALIGLALGVIGAFIRKTLYGRVDDAQEIERLLGVPVSATIPHSDGQDRLASRSFNDRRNVALLSHDASEQVIESLRRFRTSFQFAMAGSRNNIIMITGPTPGVGKSFVAANFSTVLASIGKRVLLIDADMRTGYLHRDFDLERRVGLSDAIIGEVPLDEVIHKEVRENVDFISTGNLPSSPGELLAHENFCELLKSVSSRYDFVLIDTPPVLSVSDALTIAPYAGAIFNIVRGGMNSVWEIEETVKRLNQAGAIVTGTVLNDPKSRPARYGYGYAAKYG